MTPALNFATAFAAGLLSFFSPCVLPLIPAYLSFLTGTSVTELREGVTIARLHVFTHAAAFCVGFSVIFIAAGLAAGSMGSNFGGDRVWLARAGGGLCILFGLSMLGVLRVPALAIERRFRLGTGEQRTLGTSVLFGIGFAAGWSPCIGPILGSILVMAASQDTATAALLLTAYSLGLAIPFLVTALAFGSILQLLRRLGSALRFVELTAGGVLIVMGVTLASGGLTRLLGLLAHAVGQH